MTVRVLAIGSMYPPQHLGGYELMWRSAMSELRARGCAVRVLASDYRISDSGSTAEEDPETHRELRWYWRDHEFPRISIRDRIELERANQETLARHLAEWRPDVVTWWAMGGMSLGLIETVRRAGTPAVGVVIDEWMVYGPKVDAWQRACARLGPFRGAAERFTGLPAAVNLDGAARWLFVSEAARTGARRTGLELATSSIAHGGVSRALFPPAPERAWEWKLLYVGRIDPRKGLAVAIRALAELPDASLTVIGDGDRQHLRELRDLAAGLEVDSRLDFRRLPREELAAAYAASDAVLFPVQWWEPWGLVPLEAMAVGRPVVATGTGGSAEYLRDGENCLLYEPVDEPAALALAVRRLAQDDELRARLRTGGSATAAALTEEAFNEAVADAVIGAARRS